MTIVLAVHPSSLAPWAMIEPCSVQVSVPQLMNTTFLPVGIGLVIGTLTPIDVGRCGVRRHQRAGLLQSRSYPAADDAWLVSLVLALHCWCYHCFYCLLQPAAINATATPKEAS